MTEKIIECKDLSFAYGGALVFSRVSFDITRGDFTALIGANGSGKSTLLRILLGELSPLTGSVKLFGEDISRFKGWDRIGYVPQVGAGIESKGFPATAAEVVTASLCREIGLFRFPKKQHKDKVISALETVGMADRAGQLIGAMSGGQQQRVMLARVLVSDPALLLLDEPTSGVDSETVDTLYNILEQQSGRGITVLMVTHDTARACRSASDILCLEEGSIARLGCEQLREELSHRHKHIHL